MKSTIFFLASLALAQNTFPVNGGVTIPAGTYCSAPCGGGSGTTVVPLPPYLSIGGVKYIAASMFPFTALFSGSFLDAQTFTISTGTNGDSLTQFVGTSVNSWYGTAAASSIEAEWTNLAGQQIGASPTVSGVWLCDSTNGKLYAVELVALQNAPPVYQTVSWNLPGCSGTPSAPAGVQLFSLILGSPLHARLIKSGSNLLMQISLSGGSSFQTLQTINSVGTIAKAGIELRNAPNSADWLSVAVN